MLLMCAAVCTATMLSCSNQDSAVGDVEDPKPVEHLTPVQEEAFNAGLNDFSFSTFRSMAAINPSASNVYSPVSVAAVLAMLNDGAAGQTRNELLQALGFGQVGTMVLNEYFQKILSAAPSADETVTLRLANAIFIDKGSSLKQAFADDMVHYYQAETASLDFTSPESVDFVNEWCSNQTEGLIPHFIECHCQPYSRCMGKAELPTGTG